MRQRLRQKRLAVGILEIDRETQSVPCPRDRDPEPEPDRQAWMAGRKARNPERVPATAQYEQLAPNSLYGVSQHRHIDARPQ